MCNASYFPGNTKYVSHFSDLKLPWAILQQVHVIKNGGGGGDAAKLASSLKQNCIILPFLINEIGHQCVFCEVLILYIFYSAK